MDAGEAGAGFARPAVPASLACLLAPLPFCGQAGVSRRERAAGLSVAFVFIPGVGRNNCELYFPLCGPARRLVLLIIEIITEVIYSIPFSVASRELNIIGAQFWTSSRKKYYPKMALSVFVKALGF